MTLLRTVILFCLALVAVAFSPARMTRPSRTVLAMKSNDFMKTFTASLIGASIIGSQSAMAEIDYDGIKYLGGGDKVDLNNANIRAYLKMKGMYPTIASKIVNNGPFKSVSEVYNIPGLSGAEKEILKNNEDKFVVLEGKPEYVVDKINNGLYR